MKETINNTISFDDVSKLIGEIDRLNKVISDYKTSVNEKLDIVDNQLLELEAENERLRKAKEITYIELHACVGLIAQMAKALGYKTGVCSDANLGNIVAINLPSGQVSWDFPDSESHLFSNLDAYELPLENLAIEEKYFRVMNPQI